MSRIGRLPIAIPQGVEVKLKEIRSLSKVRSDNWNRPFLLRLASNWKMAT